MPIRDWTPIPKDVGAVLRARTKDTQGNELGTFTDRTRPTGDEVNELAGQAAGDLADVLGPDLDPKWWARARSVAALGAALQVELSYFPEQVAGGRSPYSELKQLYDDRLGRLTKAVADDQTEPDEPTQAPLEPHYAFQPPCPSVFQTRW